MTVLSISLRNSAINAIPRVVEDVEIVPQIGDIKWELKDSEIIRTAERIVVIGAGGREYLKGIKKVGRREYESVTELPNNELWQGEGLTKSNQL